MKKQRTVAVGGMSVSKIEIAGDPTPGGFSDSLRLVVWIPRVENSRKQTRQPTTAAERRPLNCENSPTAPRGLRNVAMRKAMSMLTR